MEQNYRILIVDDEEDLCEILQFNLQGEGFDTETVYSAEAALEKDLKSFNLILLDVMMEKMSGFVFANKLRNELKIDIPIVFLTAKNTENDLLTGFSLKADDYITKPFSVKEVIARINAVLNRTVKHKSIEKLSLISFKEIEIDNEKKTVKIRKKTVSFTKKEFEILSFLMKNMGQIYSRDQIMDNIWGEETIVTNRTIDVHITKVRKKLGKYSKYLKNKTGYGYVFEQNI